MQKSKTKENKKKKREDAYRKGENAARKERESAYWDPHKERHPNYDEERRPKSFTVDYEKAIQNLTDILIDQLKFEEMNFNIFLAIDDDNAGVVNADVAEEFMRTFLRGN